MNFTVRLVFAVVAVGFGVVRCAADEPAVRTPTSDHRPLTSAQTGPATEQRFPPLKVPPGFKATLFACDPLIEYPSVISAGPRPGAIFVAVDYMTGLGMEEIHHSEVRLVEDTDGDGYADKATTFASGLNSIMGLAWHDGTLYVMHAPYLSALRDTKGRGVADERRDLVSGLGLPPEENPVRLHCANGVTVGHDGWLYLALGDHGCNVRRPEGDRLVLEGGGILRCRPDGRDLHIFATGLRNIYDVALDAEINVFVRDNENDGGDYKNRLYHSFFGADHGYPYLYHERPTEPLPPLADLGLGSSAGGVCYLETHFPPEYRSLYFCEWGKSLVRYPLERSGSSFAKPEELEFAAGAEGDPYGFKPTDVIVQRDGTMMVSDYADGQRPKRGRGRIYHIALANQAEKRAAPSIRNSIVQLDSESYFERCLAQLEIERDVENGQKQLLSALAAGRIGARGRLHAIWLLARAQGDKAIEPLLGIAASDAEPAVRAQAVRAIADLADPVFVHHKLDADPGDAALAKRLAALPSERDPQVRLEVVIALGRLRWAETVDWLKGNLKSPDAPLAHAAMQTIRRTGNWPAVLQLLDGPSDDPLRQIALRSVSRQYDVGLVDGLLERLSREKNGHRAREYAELVANVYKKPGPWVYWDYRPKPRPVNAIAWERTDAIAAALNQLLSGNDAELQLAALKQMQREQIPAELKSVGELLQRQNSSEHVAELLAILHDQPAADVRHFLEPVIRNPAQRVANRQSALALFVRGIDEEHGELLVSLGIGLEDGPILAEVLRAIREKGVRPTATPLLIGKLTSARSEVRAAAIEALGEVVPAEGKKYVVLLLSDRDPQVRAAAAAVAGKLRVQEAIETLERRAAADEPAVRAASLAALTLLHVSDAVPLAVAALDHYQTEQAALRALSKIGGPDQIGPVAELAKRSPSREVLDAALQTLFTWRERNEATEAHRENVARAVAEIQGTTGNLIAWNTCGHKASESIDVEPTDALLQFGTGAEGRIALKRSKRVEAGDWFQATTDVYVEDATDIELLGSSSGRLRIWLNGKSIYDRDMSQEFRVDSDRVAATLAKGANQLKVRVIAASPDSPLDFHLRFRRKSALAEHEKLLQAAINRPGNSDRGRAVFLNTDKSLCLKCHRLGDQGERTGPELTGVGNRFSRIYIAESILQPSRTIAPSFGTVVAVLDSGKTISGVKVADSEDQLTLVDNQGQKHLIAKSEIEEQHTSPLSTMPEGLEKRFSEDEFVDLVAFLASLKELAKP